MNVASKELCAELLNLSGREDTSYVWFNGSPFPRVALVIDLDYSHLVPAYDLGYLMRKLPMLHNETCLEVGFEDIDQCYAGYESVLLSRAATLEDAACKLAIELLENKI